MNVSERTVCVTGLGHIGLPTASLLANSGYMVHGVDVNTSITNQISRKSLFINEPGLQDLLHRALEDSTFTVSTQHKSSAIHIIAVPTPIDTENKPDISYVMNAISSIKGYLRPKDLILIESTCPIGTTETIADIVREKHPLLYIAYCPERVIPGNIVHELFYNSRVVGGVDEESTQKALEFYRSFVKGNVFGTDAKTAEAVKLVENSFRDVNIAFANELSMIADRLNLDINKIINLANKHPRVQILDPGPGVGGHCIPVDPWFLVSAVPDLAQIISQARSVNLSKTKWAIQKIRKSIKDNNAKKVACLGLTYKSDASDTRNSPSLQIIEALEHEVEVLCVDPYISGALSIEEACSKADIIVLLVAHTAFKTFAQHKFENKPILDFSGALK
jgi:UDP-N-acetyl-D-mannosaminuronic acid dehydrogenase